MCLIKHIFLGGAIEKNQSLKSYEVKMGPCLGKSYYVSYNTLLLSS